MNQPLSKKKFKFDFLAIGEAVVDFISCDLVSHLNNARRYELYVGGQVTNLAMNMARLGNKVALGTCLGDDGFGKLVLDEICAAGVNPIYIQQSLTAPTTLIPVTRTEIGTPEFIVYRGADTQLKSEPDLLEAATQSKILHTSAFGLSRDPTRSTILQAMEIARNNGQRVSLDPNFHPLIWPDEHKFLDILRDAYQFVNITKPSIDDCIRIFGAGFEPAEYARRFFEWGADMVVITLGSEGVFLAEKNGNQTQIFPNKTKVVDVTGAGDAFWSGLLTALLDGRDGIDAACYGQIVAEFKISNVGPLTNIPDREVIDRRAKLIQYQSLSS